MNSSAANAMWQLSPYNPGDILSGPSRPICPVSACRSLVMLNSASSANCQLSTNNQGVILRMRRTSRRGGALTRTLHGSGNTSSESSFTAVQNDKMVGSSGKDNYRQTRYST
ncbi:hypothetical protein BH23CHL4_BH23CHL4_01590 [soil metagenome]